MCHNPRYELETAKMGLYEELLPRRTCGYCGGHTYTFGNTLPGEPDGIDYPFSVRDKTKCNGCGRVTETMTGKPVSEKQP